MNAGYGAISMLGDDDTWVKSFGASLPGSYRNRYTLDEIRVHASIARTRGSSPAPQRILQSAPPTGSAPPAGQTPPRGSLLDLRV